MRWTRAGKNRYGRRAVLRSVLWYGRGGRGGTRSVGRCDEYRLCLPGVRIPAADRLADRVLAESGPADPACGRKPTAGLGEPRELAAVSWLVAGKGHVAGD